LTSFIDQDFTFGQNPNVSCTRTHIDLPVTKKIFQKFKKLREEMLFNPKNAQSEMILFCLRVDKIEKYDKPNPTYIFRDPG
jgi:hypothetical protein